MEKLIKFPFANADPRDIAFNLKNVPPAAYIIEGIPNDDIVLENFVRQIGIPVQEERNLRNDITYKVNVSKENDLFKSYANTNFCFPLHTDCSDFEDIPNCLAMYCAISAKEGGESNFVTIEDLIPHFSDQEVCLMLEKEWKFRNISKPILQKSERGYTICYNRIMMETYAKLTKLEQDFLDKFDKIASLYSYEYKLEPGELILLRNDKYLHGRNEFPVNSNRLIKRIRFSIKSSKEQS